MSLRLKWDDNPRTKAVEAIKVSKYLEKLGGKEESIREETKTLSLTRVQKELEKSKSIRARTFTKGGKGIGNRTW